MMSKKMLYLMSFVLALCLPVLSAGAVEFLIDNPGFEIPVLANDGWDYSLDNEGWGYFNNGGNLGPWNPTNSDYVGEAPEGENVGWSETTGGVPGGFAQVLLDPDAVLKLGTYTLTVKVGAARTYSSGGYIVQLLAGGTPHTPGIGADYAGPVVGGTLLEQDDNSLHPIKAGSFETVTVRYTYDAAAHSALLGEPMQIRLLARPGGDETEFDDVKLSWEGPTASNPYPPNNAVDVPVDANLSWDRGKFCIQDEVYFGTDPVMGNLPKVATLSAASQDPMWNPPGDLIASTTYYWYVVETDSNKPHMPMASWSFTTVRGEAQCDSPFDGAIIDGDIDAGSGNVWTKLIFIPGPTAVKHTAYFSEDYSKVDGRAQDANLGEPPFPSTPGWEYTYFVGNPSVGPVIDTLVRGTKYYWTLDATDAWGNKFSGDIWEFTIKDYYAYAPSPPNEAMMISADVLLRWQPGIGAEDHDIYMGTSWEDVNNAVYSFTTPPPEFVDSRKDPNYQTSGLPFETKLYWRVDEVSGRLPPSLGTIYKGNVWNFTTQPKEVGTIREDLWWNVGGGNAIANLYNDPRFPANPDETRSLTMFDSGTGLGDNYGGMIHGWLHPAKSGDYRFWIAADDTCELFLSTDHQPANMQRIAYAPGWLNQYEWNWYTTQRSTLIPLVAGQKYYIRACWKEGGGGDHCEVAWQGPDQPIMPLYGSSAAVINGNRLSPFVQLWAHSPDPRDGQASVPAGAYTLEWGPGDHAAEHEVYFGTDKDAVTNATPTTPGIYKGRIGPNSLSVVLAAAQFYHWRVDEVNSTGPDPGLWKGDTWTFRTEGAAGGLLGLYYHWDGYQPDLPVGPPNPFQVFVMSRIDPEVNFNWGNGTPDPSVNTNFFACRWVGHVECPVDADYTFTTECDDGARLFIDDQEIIPTAAWSQGGMRFYSGNIVLSAGLHDIEMHMYEREGGAGARLRWSATPTNPSDDPIPQQIIPAMWLWPSLFASAPRPIDGATVDDRKPALEWIAGFYADYHELYFSENFDDVNNRNPAVKQTLGDPCRPYPAVPPLELGKTYYWLVDEVKISPADRWNARTVWSFTISECISLDNMELYNDRNDIRVVWRDGNADVVWTGSHPYLTLVQGGSSGSNLNVSTAVGSPT
ncbi:MAG: PA14 domain-containing protein, partial [Planctomycetota bacterium]